MDAAPDTSLLALSAPGKVGAQAVNLLDSNANNSNKQSFTVLLRGELSAADAASASTDAGPSLPTTAFRSAHLEPVDSALQAGLEDIPPDAGKSESGKTLPAEIAALPLSGTNSEASAIAKEKNVVAGVPGFAEASLQEPGIARQEQAAALENRITVLGQNATDPATSRESKTAPEGLDLNKGLARQNESATALDSKAERAQLAGSNRVDEGVLFRQQDAGNSIPVSKSGLTSESKVDVELRSSADMLNGRSPDQQTGLQSLLSNSSTAVKAQSLHINTPMQADSAWANAFSEKISWLIGKGEQSATIQLAPEELGKLQLRITMNQGGTQIEVHARNQNTAELMEAMLPKLQTSLESQGIRMDEVKFSQVPLDTGSEFSRQLAQEGKAHSDAGQGSTEPEAASVDSGEEDVALESSLSSPAGVDYYA